MSSMSMRRWFFSVETLTKRIAAHTTRWKRRRLSRWMIIGTATAPAPKSRNGLRKLI